MRGRSLAATLASCTGIPLSLASVATSESSHALGFLLILLTEILFFASDLQIIYEGPEPGGEKMRLENSWGQKTTYVFMIVIPSGRSC
jgi:hypothetical protein